MSLLFTPYTSVFPVGLRFNLVTTSGVITVFVAPVSHIARNLIKLGGPPVGRTEGKPTLTSVIISFTIPSYSTRNA